MRLETANFIGKVINIWLILLFGLVPLFFIPLTSEFYEFNKVLLSSFSAGLLAVLWFTKSALLSRFSVRTSKLDITIIIFVLVNILAASFSVDRYVSVAGWYPRFNHSLIFILSSSAIYFIAANNLTKKSIKFAILSIYTSIFILSILGIMSYLGIFLPFEFAKLRSWTPTTTINNLGLMLAIGLPLGIYLSTKAYSESKSFLNYIFPLTLLPVLTCLTFVNIFGAWLVAIVSIFVLVISERDKIFSKRSFVLWIIVPIWLLITLFAYTPGLNTSTIGRLINAADKQDGKHLNFPKEVTLSQSVSYSTAIGVIRNQNRALLGSGQGTFLYAYTQLKPQSVNQTDFWSLRFDQPASEILMIIAGTGVAGLLSFVIISLLLVRYLYINLRNTQNEKSQAKFVALSLFGLVIGSFFFVYNASLTLIFFGLLGILSSSSFARSEISLKKSHKKSAQKINHTSAIAIPLVLLVISIGVFVYTSMFLIKAFEAETHFQKSALATNRNDGAATLQEQIAAIKENGSESTYRKQLVLTDIALARSILQKAQAGLDPNDPESKIGQKDQDDVTALINQAIEQGKIITAYQINPQQGSSNLNVSNWETLGLVYRSLIGVAKDAELHALRTQQQAIFLDPQNPTLYINLGRTFLALGNTDSAVTNFEEAIQRKPDYALGYVALSQALKNRPGSADRRAAALQTALNIIPTDNPSRPDIQKEWEDALAQAQKEKDQNPQPQQPTSPTPAPNQATQSAQP